MSKLIPEILVSYYFRSLLFPELLAPDEPVWRCLDGILDFLTEASPPSSVKGFIHRAADVHESATIIRSYIGDGCRIWEGVTVRHSIIGDGTEIGHACEVARSIVLRNAAISHFNYVGDSVIGNDVCFGASSVVSNRRLDDAPISVAIKGRRFESARSKLGAVVGDNCQIGAGCLVNPGALIGPASVVMPGAIVTGFIPRDSAVRVEHNVHVDHLQGKSGVP